jgi:hypothetical protein
MPLPVTAVSCCTDYDGAAAGVPLACNFDTQGIDASEIFLATLDVGGDEFENVDLSDYTVTDMGGGVFTVTPDLTYAAGITVRVFRFLPYTQEFIFSEGGPFPAQQVMAMGNRLCQQIQQVRAEAGLDVGVVTIPPGAALVLPTITFDDAADLALTTPAFLGQVGVQLDTGVLYRGTTIAAGGWTVMAAGSSGTVATGGTGLTSLTPYALMAGGTTGTGDMQQVAGLGTSGQFLRSNGAAALPTWQTVALGSGDVVGPASSVDSTLALFDGVTGKLLKAAQGVDAATAASLNLGSITDATARALTISQTWNNAGLAGKLLILDATSTNSTAASTLQEWRTSGANRGKLYRDGEFRLLNGSVGSPTFSFEAQTGTGMYYTGAGLSLAFAVFGTQILTLSDSLGTGVVTSTGVFVGGNGTVTSPTYAVGSRGGMYSTAVGEVALATTGVGRARVDADGISPFTTGVGTLGTAARQWNGAFFSGPVKLAGYTVATLPAGSVGMRAYVTDSNAAITAGIGAVVAGGGANVVPVFYDGANWRIC